KGLNENLAREIFELHTLGVRTVYTQADVTSFAKVITGWSIVPPKEPERGGEFFFNPRMHQPGAQDVIGRSYADAGFEQGRAVLAAPGTTPPDIRPVLQADNLLREPLWRPPAPKGFPDDSAAWMDGLAERLDVAKQLARRVAALADPEAVADVALGPLASAE